MEYLTVITADDVIRAGACESGVYELLERLHPKLSAAMNVHEILPMLDEDEKKYVREAAVIDGNGNGDGYGDGYGYGYGYGDGSGYGSGYGSGSGSGDLERCTPEVVKVRAAQLRGACRDQVRHFKEVFPEGAEWPTDCAKAVEAGLDVSWAITNLGLLPEIVERIEVGHG